MNKTFTALCLAALLALPLAGCGNNPSNAEHQTNTASPSPTNPGTDDLAGADGVVGDNSGELPGHDDTAGTAGDIENGTGVTDNNTGENASAGTDAGRSRSAGRADDSALERVGEGIEDTIEDIGHGMKRMADNAGQDARRMGQATRQALQ